jgi:hypothetical protein
MRKFILMSFFTMGLYDIYWFYWNWRRQRAQGEAISAGWRAFLSPFVAYLLFRDVKRVTSADWNAALLAVVYFLMVMCFAAPGWWWILTWLAFLPLIPVQLSINVLHAKDPNGEIPDDDLTAINICGMLAGALFMALLVALGLMMDSGAFKSLQIDPASILGQ